MKKIITLSLLFIFSLSFSQIELLKDINPGTPNSLVANFKVFDGSLLFTADNSVNGVELWKSDGTTSGTTLLKDINTGTSGSSAGFPFVNSGIVYNNELYFSANNGTLAGETGRELWKTNGTTAGTVLVKDIRSGSANSDLNKFVLFNNEIYFTANDGIIGNELWKSNGTTAGTVNAVDYAGTSNQISKPVVMGGFMYYAQNSGGVGRELYKSDGTLAGTTLVKDIFVGTGSSIYPSIDIFKASNNTLYFVATDNVTGYELWKSDGTNAGTTLVKDIYTGVEGSTPFGFFELNGFVYFLANDGFNEILWKTDGTSAGTTKLFDNTIFPEFSFLTGRVSVFDNAIYFWADNTGLGTGIDFYKFDGTTLTTLLDLNTDSAQTDFAYKIGTTIYFDAPDLANTTSQLWQTNGTPTGTVPVASLFPSSLNPTNVTNIIAYNDKIYFRGSTPTTGIELFVYDPSRLNTTTFNSIAKTKLYPNPVTSIVNIENTSEITSVTIYNLVGQQVLEKQVNATATQIDMSGLNTGVYLAKVAIGNSVNTYKLVKNN